MAYRFNSGKGGVTCDACQVLIDENIGYKDYIAIYRKAHPQDICWECKAEADKKRKRPEAK
jgi:hypothetical protein